MMHAVINGLAVFARLRWTTLFYLDLRPPLLPLLSEHRATRFLHLWRSLATLFAPVHVTLMLFRSLANVSQVFCGFPLDLLRFPESVHADVCSPDFWLFSL